MNRARGPLWAVSSMCLAALGCGAGSDNGATRAGLERIDQEEMQKLMVANDSMPNQGPCHELIKTEAKYSYPASIVAYDGWRIDACQDGVCSSSEYQAQTFLNIESQVFDPGQKTYFKPLVLHNKGDLTGEFVGFDRYRVAKIVQPYDVRVHPRWNTRRLGTFVVGSPGLATVENDLEHARSFSIPGRTGGLNSPYDFCLRQGDAERCYVGFEMCYGKTPFPRKDEISNLFWSDWEPYRSYDYEPHKTPVYLGYAAHFGDRIQETIDRLTAFQQGLFIAAEVLPDAGIGKLFQCADPELRSPYCFYEFWAEATGELSGFLRIDALSKFKGGAAIAEKFGNKPFYGAVAINIGTNATLAQYYAREGDWLSAASRVVESTVSTTLLVHLDGAVHITPGYEVDPAACTRLGVQAKGKLVAETTGVLGVRAVCRDVVPAVPNYELTGLSPILLPDVTHVTHGTAAQDAANILRQGVQMGHSSGYWGDGLYLTPTKDGRRVIDGTTVVESEKAWQAGQYWATRRAAAKGTGEKPVVLFASIDTKSLHVANVRHGPVTDLNKGWVELLDLDRDADLIEQMRCYDLINGDHRPYTFDDDGAGFPANGNLAVARPGASHAIEWTHVAELRSDGSIERLLPAVEWLANQ